jgi:flotillin
MDIMFFIFAGLVFLGFLMILFLVSRYKRCPSDKILVIYGRTGSGSAKTLAGGAAFVWPRDTGLRIPGPLSYFD